MRKKIALITGGNSSENVISVKSADTVLANIDKEKYEPFRVEINGRNWKVILGDDAVVDVNKNDFSFILDGQKQLFDCALIMIHGDPGEDGRLQGYLDMLKVPYTASGVLSSSATFSKHFTKQYLKSYNIASAEWMFLSKRLGYDLSAVESQIGYPCFVKPNNAGSSFGVSKVNSFAQLKDAVEKAISEDDEVLVEKMVEGVEITCGVLRTLKNVYVFPITEIVSKTGFFDYDAKYTDGLADEIVPARISDEIAKRCKELSLKIYDIFNCQWFARVDYILQGNELIPLEINTIPGMSKESIVPKMLAAENIELQVLLDEVLDDLMSEGL